MRELKFARVSRRKRKKADSCKSQYGKDIKGEIGNNDGWKLEKEEIGIRVYRPLRNSDVRA